MKTVQIQSALTGEILVLFVDKPDVKRTSEESAEELFEILTTNIPYHVYKKVLKMMNDNEIVK